MDMDGVMADFMLAAHNVLGRAFDDHHWKTESIDKRQIIHKTKDFWVDMPPMPDFRELWSFIKPFNPHILSAYPEWDTNGIAGKRKWIAKHMGHIPNERIHLVLRAEKENYATTDGKPNVLVDDYDKNVNAFKAAGGIGVLHVGAGSTIMKLKQLGFH
jgi:hypothetical protein